MNVSFAEKRTLLALPSICFSTGERQHLGGELRRAAAINEKLQFFDEKLQFIIEKLQFFNENRNFSMKNCNFQ